MDEIDSQRLYCCDRIDRSQLRVNLRIQTASNHIVLPLAAPWTIINTYTRTMNTIQRDLHFSLLFIFAFDREQNNRKSLADSGFVQRADRKFYSQCSGILLSEYSALERHHGDRDEQQAIWWITNSTTNRRENSYWPECCCRKRKHARTQQQTREMSACQNYIMTWRREYARAQGFKSHLFVFLLHLLLYAKKHTIYKSEMPIKTVVRVVCIQLPRRHTTVFVFHFLFFVFVLLRCIHKQNELTVMPSIALENCSYTVFFVARSHSGLFSFSIFINRTPRWPFEWEQCEQNDDLWNVLLMCERRCWVNRKCYGDENII